MCDGNGRATLIQERTRDLQKPSGGNGESGEQGERGRAMESQKAAYRCVDVSDEPDAACSSCSSRPIAEPASSAVGPATNAGVSPSSSA